MTRTTLSTRSRAAVLATGLALSLSLVVAPAAVAQDDPTAPVNEFVAALSDADYAAIPALFCDEFAAQAARFDPSGMAASLPPTVDADLMTNAIRFVPTLDSLDVVSQTADEAIVHAMGTLELSVDEAAIEPLLTAILEAGGQEVTPDMVAMLSGMFLGQLAEQAIEIDEDIRVVPKEDGTWGLICSALGSEDDMMDDGSMDDGSMDSDEAMVEPDASMDPDEGTEDEGGE